MTIAPSATPIPPTATSISSQAIVKELGTYSKAGTTWKNIFVMPGIDRGTLISLAKEIHGKDPRNSYRFFDDDGQFKQFMDWGINYPNPRFPFPEAWTNKHHWGNVQQMFEGGRMRWRLWDPLEKIAALE